MTFPLPTVAAAAECQHKDNGRATRDQLWIRADHWSPKMTQVPLMSSPKGGEEDNERRTRAFGFNIDFTIIRSELTEGNPIMYHHLLTQCETWAFLVEFTLLIYSGIGEETHSNSSKSLFFFKLSFYISLLPPSGSLLHTVAVK